MKSFLLAVLITSACLSGCLFSENKEDQYQSIDDEIDVDEFSVHCLEHDNLERCWLLLVPAILNESTNIPLLVDIHGGGDDMYQQRWTSDFANLSIEQGFIVAYPQGHDNLWNQAEGVIPGANEEDVGFIIKMIDEIKNNYTIDHSRIYVTGWSNGCGMAHRLAVQASDVFAAAGCMSMYQFANVDTEYSPIPFMEVHGLLDEAVHYGSTAVAGIVLGIPGTGVEQGAMQNLEWWANLNGCQGISPEILVIEEDYDIRGYTECENGAEVMLMTLFYSTHNPYLHDDPITDTPGRGEGNPTGIPSSRILWDFMLQFSR